ncbi:MAG TPA: aminotransferase class V-fold PLP-dependent enzyme [Candidatus Cybelea sp.]|jgi:glutamate/tyrosine decarboxylase-like PLP-dependent enzyme|nr:aminotransferase class V-fold PLP-dependent enzyme [Candidatus Cybelea sp.]
MSKKRMVGLRRDRYAVDMVETHVRPYAALALAASSAIGFLEGLDSMPLNAAVEPAVVRRRLDRPLPEWGIPAEAAVDTLVRNVRDCLIGSQSGRFFAWVIGGSLPAALAADWLTSAWGQNAALYDCSPAAAAIEELAGIWLKELLGLPQEASFAFATGCQMAHVTALAAARHALLRDRGWDVEARGLFGAPQIHIVGSNRHHASIVRAIRMLGFGTQSFTALEPTSDETLDPNALAGALAQLPEAPTIVLLQAGDINTGAFDSCPELIAIAKRHRAWVHVDGAFGLFAAACARYRHLTAGMDKADSWATDGHKWLNVPFDVGYAFVRDADAHRAAMTVAAPYIRAGQTVRDEIDWNPEWSRRARGFSTYAALLQLGRRGVDELIERTCRYARAIVDALGSLPGVEVVWRPIINQGLVRFLDSRPGATAADHDRRTEAVTAAVASDGEAFFAASTWRGKRVMRVSVVNWRTSEDDVERTIAAVARRLAG